MKVLQQYPSKLFLPGIFFILLMVTIPATSIGQSGGCQEVGCVRSTYRAASISSEDGVLLNALTNALLGSSVNLTAIEWTNLAQTNINLLGYLEVLQTQVTAGSPAQVLDTEVTLVQIIDAAIDVAQTDGNTAAVSALQQLRLAIDLLTPLSPIKLGDLLQLNTNETSIADISLNILELIQGSISLFNYQHVASTPGAVNIQGIDLGIASVINDIQLHALVLEPPVYSCGGAGTQFYSAGIRTKLDLDLIEIDISNEILGLISVPPELSDLEATIGQLDLYAAVSRGQGVIETIDAINNAITINADPGVVDLYLGQIEDNIFFNRSAVINPASDVQYGKVGEIFLSLIGFPLVEVDINALAHTEGNDPFSNVLSFNGSFPQQQTAGNSSTFVTNLVSTLLGNVDVEMEITSPPIVGPLLGSILNPLLDDIAAVLPDIFDTVLAPVLDMVLLTVVDPVLELLGTGVGEMDVTAAGLQRNCVALLGGFVYEDLNHNVYKENSENGAGLSLYAKRIDQSHPGQADTVVVVDPVTGNYDLGLCKEGTYQVIVDDNNNESDVTPFKPSEWIGTENPDQLIDNIVIEGAGDWTDLNFGLYHGSKITGSIFNDNGVDGGTPHNGIQETGEKDLHKILVRALTPTGTEVGQTRTDAEGLFTLWIGRNYDGQQILIKEEQGQQYISVSGNAGTTGGTYDRSQDQLTYTSHSGIEYENINFADVSSNSFTPLGRQYANPGSVIFYRHNYKAKTPGEVTFNLQETSSPANNTWSYSLFEDINCNGKIDQGSDTNIPASQIMNRGDEICMVAQIQVPADIEAKAQDVFNIEADFTLSTTSITYPKNVHDKTIVGIPSGAGLLLEKTVDKESASPGEALTYEITYRNNSSEPLRMLSIDDSTPSYTIFSEATCGMLPGSLTSCTIRSPATGTEGVVVWEFEGQLQPGNQGKVMYEVTIEN